MVFVIPIPPMPLRGHLGVRRARDAHFLDGLPHSGPLFLRVIWSTEDFTSSPARGPPSPPKNWMSRDKTVPLGREGVHLPPRPRIVTALE